MAHWKPNDEVEIRPLPGPAMGSLARLRELEADFLCLELKRWGMKPPLPFGAAERVAITAEMEQSFAKKHGRRDSW